MNQSDQCHLQFPSNSLLVLPSHHHHESTLANAPTPCMCLPIRRTLRIYTQQNTQDLLFRQIAVNVGVRLTSWGDLRNRLRMKKGFFLWHCHRKCALIGASSGKLTKESTWTRVNKEGKVNKEQGELISAGLTIIGAKNNSRQKVDRKNGHIRKLQSKIPWHEY